MFEELESIIIGAVFFDEHQEFYRADEIDVSLFDNKSLLQKVMQWRKDQKPFDLILAMEHFTPIELKAINAGISKMGAVSNLQRYCQLHRRKKLEYAISQQIERNEIDTQTLTKYIDAVNSSGGSEKIYNLEGDITEYINRFEERAVGKFERYALNLSGLDDTLGYVRPKRFYTIGASPGVGKTNIMLAIMLEQMKKSVPCLFFTAEMDYDSLVERMAAMCSGLRLFDILNARLKPEDIGEYTQAIGRDIYGKKSFIFETPRFSVGKIKELIDKTGAKFVFVDYLQKFSLTGGRNDTRASVMSDIANGLKEISMGKNVVIFAGSQLGKMSDRRDAKLSDLKESGGIEEASDGIILLSEAGDDEQYKKIKVNVAKNKYGICDTFVYVMDRKSCKMAYSPTDTIAIKG